MCTVTAIDLQALSEADLVVVGTVDGRDVLLRPAAGPRSGGSRTCCPAMAGKQAVTYVTFALEPRHALDKLSDIVRATGADVIGGMAIRRDDIEGGAKDLAEPAARGGQPRLRRDPSAGSDRGGDVGPDLQAGPVIAATAS